MVIALAAAIVGGATMAWFNDSASSSEVEFSTGTVLIEAGTSGVIKTSYFDTDSEGTYLYGVERTKGDLYEIDVLNGTVHKFYDMPNLTPADGIVSPNGLGLDSVNKRLYFSVKRSNNLSELYFYDFNSSGITSAGNAPGIIYGATYGEGYYWYIRDNTADLYRIKFNPATGMVEEGNTDPFKINIAGNKKFQFGDIDLDISEGVIYASTSGAGGTSKEYFKYDIANEDYTPITYDANDALNLQLAFGSNGQLYGHLNPGSGIPKWYQVNKETGKISEITVEGNKLFQDLASGFSKVWNPGDCDKVKYNVKNIGNKKIHVRVKLSGSWQEYRQDGDPLRWGWYEWTPPPGDDVVTFSNCDNSWNKDGDYFYYKGAFEDNKFEYILYPNQEAELCLMVCLDGPNTTNEYQGKRYVIEATFDAIQTTHGASNDAAVNGGWGWTPPQ